MAPSLSRRLLCALYEAILLVAVWILAGLALLLAANAFGRTPSRALMQLYLIAVTAAYFLPQWRAGQTLPMKTWRIRLESATSCPVTWRGAVVRFVLAAANCVLLGCGYWWALLDRDRQFLQDRLAGTRLVHADAVSVSPAGR